MNAAMRNAYDFLCVNEQDTIYQAQGLLKSFWHENYPEMFAWTSTSHEGLIPLWARTLQLYLEELNWLDHENGREEEFDLINIDWLDLAAETLWLLESAGERLIFGQDLMAA